MAIIDWDSIIGSGTIADGGYVGDLMTLARAHIDAAVDDNRITQAQAGEVYTAMVPAAMEHGIGFAMQDEMTEKQIEQVAAETIVTQQKIVGRRQQPALRGN